MCQRVPLVACWRARAQLLPVLLRSSMRASARELTG
jgi:hypothetical protein